MQTYLHKIPDYIISQFWGTEQKDKELVLKEGNSWAMPELHTVKRFQASKF